jgi:hypothetical protein
MMERIKVETVASTDFHSRRSQSEYSRALGNSWLKYTTACHVNPRNYFWRDEIDTFLEPMPQERDMEQIRLRYFGDVRV